MYKHRTFIGLDLATTAGIAVWIPEEGTARAYTTTGNPIRQLEFLHRRVFDNSLIEPIIIGIEQLDCFRNAKTVRSLLERIGYFRYSLTATRLFDVVEVRLSPTRKYYGFKDKMEVLKFFQKYTKTPRRLTNDMSDALLIAVWLGHQEDVELDDGFEEVIVKP